MMCAHVYQGQCLCALSTDSLYVFIPGESPWLVYSNRYYIRNLTLDASSYGLVKMGLRNVVALSFDYREERLYYCDVGNKVIQRMFLNGTMQESIIRHDTHGLEGISVDWVGR